ncbi:hypothetical protein GS534_04540 [Rhodococcus hoagii]|nr:hypothetical protein [Prescottella equi]
MVGLGGPATIPLDIASSVVQAGMGSEKLTLPEEASENQRRQPATQRAYRMLEAVVAKDPSILDGPDGTSTIPEDLRDERGLRPLTEIMDDDKRGLGYRAHRRRGIPSPPRTRFQRFDLPLNSARDNQAGYVTDEAHYRSADPGRFCAMKRVASLAIALAAGVLSLTACTREMPVENMPDPLWAESFRWESTPGTDLDSPAAQLVRATVESDEITLTLGRRYTYPVTSTLPVSTAPHGPTALGRIGTLTMKLVELEQTPDAVEALACLDTTQSQLSSTANTSCRSRVRSMFCMRIGSVHG